MSNGSFLWQFFTRAEQYYARCNECKAKISYKTTTANLKKHMMRKHATQHFIKAMSLVQGRTQARMAQKSRQALLEQCDPYENVILYDGKREIHPESADSSQENLVEQENESSKIEPLDNDEPVSDIEYPFDEEPYDTIQPRPWTPVYNKVQSKEQQETLVEVCQKLVKTLEAREARDERLYAQQQTVIAKLDQTLLLMTQVLVKLNDKFDKL